MNALTGENLLDLASIEREIVARDREIDNLFSKDMQVVALRGSRNYLGDKLIRTAKPHKLLDPKAGPLIAVRLHILTRKTLGGLETDLSSRVFGHERRTGQWTVCGGRDSRIWWRRCAWLPLFRGYFSGWLYILRPRCRTSRRPKLNLSQATRPPEAF